MFDWAELSLDFQANHFSRDCLYHAGIVWKFNCLKLPLASQLTPHDAYLYKSRNLKDGSSTLSAPFPDVVATHLQLVEVVAYTMYTWLLQLPCPWIGGCHFILCHPWPVSCMIMNDSVKFAQISLLACDCISIHPVAAICWTSCGFGEVPFHKYPERMWERHSSSAQSKIRVACSVKSLHFVNSILDVFFTRERVLHCCTFWCPTDSCRNASILLDSTGIHWIPPEWSWNPAEWAWIPLDCYRRDLYKCL